MAKTFRIHVLGVPHTQTNTQFTGCAFTQKVVKFVDMMASRGHQIYHYGHELSRIPEQPNVEHITVITDREHRRAYGDEYVDQQRWRDLGFAHYYDIQDHAHCHFHATAIKEIHKRKEPNDLLLCFWGWGVKPIADALPDLIAIEPGIGYGGAWARWRVYESHSIRNAMTGIDGVRYCDQDWYHVVIPNYFDPQDFAYNTDKDDYVLYLGRIGWNKGVDIAIQATRAAGKRLIIAGQGSITDLGYTSTPEHVTCVGYADQEMRKMLMSKAQSLFIASRYLEPFGGVQVEAWLSGTPVISPDWGAFAEFNHDGVTGYRCRTHRDFVRAIESADEIKPYNCKKHAQQFTYGHIAPQYERYFEDVDNVYTRDGWYTI